MATFGDFEHDELVAISSLVVQYGHAPEAWRHIVNAFVPYKPDRSIIERYFAEDKDQQAYLHTLELLQAAGTPISDFLDVLEDPDRPEINLGDLARRIRERDFDRSARRSRAGIWFEVDDEPVHVTPRTAELDQLHEALTKTHSNKKLARNIVSICAPAGFGKSTLALMYAHAKEEQHYHRNVVWVNGGSKALMKRSFTRLARQELGLEVKAKEESAQLAAKVYARFRDKESLFIFDNVMDTAAFAKFKPVFKNPRYYTPHVLVITKWEDETFKLVELEQNRLPLSVPDLDELAVVVRAQLSSVAHPEAKELAAKLGAHPLTLRLAISFIKEKYPGDPDSIPKYLHELESVQLQVGAVKPIIQIGAVWRRARTRIRAKGGDGHAAVTFAALLALVKLDVDDSEENPEIVKKLLLLREDEEVTSVLGLLNTFGVAQMQGDAVTIVHPLLGREIVMSTSLETLTTWADSFMPRLGQEALNQYVKLFKDAEIRNKAVYGEFNRSTLLCKFLKGRALPHGSGREVKGVLKLYMQIYGKFEKELGKGHRETVGEYGGANQGHQEGGTLRGAIIEIFAK